MNLYLRLLYLVIASFFKPRIADILSTASLYFRVLPNDLDLNGHMNNGRYLTIMDLGRLDFVLRLPGLAHYVLKHKYIPVLSGAAMRYRLPLLPWQKYRTDICVICWDDKWVYMEQRFVIIGGRKDGAVAAIGLLKGSFFSKEQRATMPIETLLQAVNWTQPSPPMPDYIARWIETEDTLRAATAQAE